MSLRRYTPLQASKGTQIPPRLRLAIFERDQGCVGRRLYFPVLCSGALEVDHVRASHGMGMKSRTEPDNLVALCGACHRWKTENGRTARPLLLAYLERVDNPHAAHIDPCSSTCRQSARGDQP